MKKFNEFENIQTILINGYKSITIELEYIFRLSYPFFILFLCVRAVSSMWFIVIHGLDRFERKWQEQITIPVVELVHKFHPKDKRWCKILSSSLSNFRLTQLWLIKRRVFCMLRNGFHLFLSTKWRYVIWSISKVVSFWIFKIIWLVC